MLNFTKKCKICQMKHTTLTQFGERIRTLRKQHHLTQEQLGEITGFHHNYIGMVERGERNPALLNLEIFAKAFEMSLAELFDFENKD